MTSQFKKLFKRKSDISQTDDLGLDLAPGDDHYRAYVGPPKDYDLVSAMVFNLLTCSGLKQHHRVLDIGCGSLRNGRLLIPYLNQGNYFGVEPNKWLVDDGIKKELGSDLIRIKQPVFSYRDSLEEFSEPVNIDFAFAQSIFSHTGTNLLKQWLSEIAHHLSPNGILLATFLPAENDSHEDGWIYPGCTYFNPNSVKKTAHGEGLKFKMIDWFHPRQSWAAFYKNGCDSSELFRNPISWNHLNGLQSKQ